jgi:hypothetical protein
MTETDAVLNAETRRALRAWGRKLSAVGAGVLTALVMLIPTAVTAMRPVGLSFHLAVTLAVSLSLPVMAAYVAVRTYGLSHHEAVSVGKQVLREAVTATVTLSEHQRVEQPTDGKKRTTVNDATTLFADRENDDTQ